MAILILNQYPPTRAPYGNILRPYTKEPMFLLTSHQKGEITGDYASVEYISNFSRNGNVERHAVNLHKKNPVKHLVATFEFDLIRAAQLRELFGITGQNVKSATAFRNKVIMKDYARQAVQIPAYANIETPLDVITFIDTNGYPCVIKPVDGADSRGVTILREEDDLIAYLAKSFAPGYEIEEFVDGDMYTIDGLYHNGRIVLYWAGCYFHPCLDFQDGKTVANYQLAGSHPLSKRLYAFAESLFSAMPMPPTTTFHTEVFHTPDDRLVLCEVASRTGGAGMNDLGLLSYGVDITLLWILGQCNLLEEQVYTRGPLLYGWVIVPPREGVLQSMPEKIPYGWVCGYAALGQPGKTYAAPAGSTDTLALLLVSGETESEVVERLAAAKLWVEQNCEWS